MSATFKSAAVLCAVSLVDAQHQSSERYWAQQKLDSIQYNTAADNHRWGRSSLSGTPPIFGPSTKITNVYNTLGDYKSAQYAAHKVTDYLATTTDVDHDKLYDLQLDSNIAESDYMSQLFSTRTNGGSPGTKESPSAFYWTKFRQEKREKAERAYEKALAGGEQSVIDKSHWQLDGHRDYETSALAFYLGDKTIGHTFLAGAASTFVDIAQQDLDRANQKYDGTDESWKAVEKAEDAYELAHYNHMRRVFGAFGDSKMSLLAKVLGSNMKSRLATEKHHATYPDTYDNYYDYYDNYDNYDNYGSAAAYSLFGR